MFRVKDKGKRPIVKGMETGKVQDKGKEERSNIMGIERFRIKNKGKGLRLKGIKERFLSTE